MLAVFLQSLQSRRTAILAYTLGALAVALLYISFYPAIQEQSAQLDEVMKSLPQGLLKVLGRDALDFTQFGNYIATELFAFIWPLLAMFMTVSFAGGSLAGEIESGTIELLLSQPVSRTKLFFGRFLAGVSASALFSAASVLGIIPLAGLYGIDYSLSGVLIMAVLAFGFCLAVISLSFLCSVIYSEKGKVYFTMAALLLAMYVAHVASTLEEGAAWLKYGSFFYYLNPIEALSHSRVEPVAAAVFIATSVVATALAVWRFNRRDIAV